MELKQTSRGQKFAAWILEHRHANKGFAAALRHADNPDTEYRAMGSLCAFGVDIEDHAQRLPFALIGAALCRSNSETDGDCGLGQALRRSAQDRDIEEDNPRLRRILACDSVDEICRVLRPVLSFLEASGARICLGQLLDDLLSFNNDTKRQRIRLRWAREYYYRPSAKDSSVDQGDESCDG